MHGTRSLHIHKFGYIILKLDGVALLMADPLPTSYTKMWCFFLYIHIHIILSVNLFTWHVTCDTWHVARDMQHMTRRGWKTFSKQLPTPTVWEISCFKDTFTKGDSLTQLITKLCLGQPRLHRFFQRLDYRGAFYNIATFSPAYVQPESHSWSIHPKPAFYCTSKGRLPLKMLVVFITKTGVWGVGPTTNHIVIFQPGSGQRLSNFYIFLSQKN